MDIALKETNNGGDIIKKSRDLLIVFGFQNMPYLAMFGGNVAASTPVRRIESEQAFDWWANSLLMSNNSAIQMNSETERILLTTPLSSSGRTQIEQAIRKDLEFLKPFAKVSVTVTIPATDRVEFKVLIAQPDNVERTEFRYVWDVTKRELVDPYNDLKTPPPVLISGFDYTFDFTL